MWETRSVFHISMPWFLRQDCLRCRWPITQCRMRPLRVVFHAPPLRQNLCLLQRVKDLAVQELIAQLSVEASQYPFSHGLPGSMYNVLVPTDQTGLVTTPAPPPAVSTCRSLFPGPSIASPGPSSNRRILSASGRTSGLLSRLPCRLVEWFFRWRC